MEMFARKTTFGGGFNAASARVMFAGFSVGMAFESVSMQFSQQVARILDLDGENRTSYLVAGYPMGSGSVGRVIGPRAVSDAFYARYSDVCNAGENILTLDANIACDASTGATNRYPGSLTVKLGNVVINSLGVTMNSNDPIIRQSMAFTFLTLDWSEGSGN